MRGAPHEASDDGEKMILKCECGGNVNSEAKQCPHCGKPGPFTPPPKPAPSLLPQLILAIVLSLVGLAALVKLMN
ncbi:MAG: hypothetical protein K8U03_24665 [Planctomycetia bacterium]|nr:hypothetical protein [Planctomycetia bacterium]